MSTVNFSTAKNNNQIMADSLLNVQNIELKNTTFSERSKALIPELLIGVPITGAIATFPYWKNYALHPINSFSNIKKPNINFNIKPKITSASNWIKDKTKYNTLKSTITSSERGAAALKLAKAGMGLKGMGIFAAIGAVFEIPNLISAHDADKAEKANGNNNSNHLARQAVKSTTKVGAGVLGYAAGAAAAGAVAGSVFPGLGNVAGTIVGFVGGCIGGMVANYAADKVVGEKTEAEEYMAKVDKDNQEKANILAIEAEKNPETNAQMLSAIYEKIKNGEITDKNVIEAFQKEAANYESSQTIPKQQTSYITQNSEYDSLLSQLNSIKNCCKGFSYNA